MVSALIARAPCSQNLGALGEHRDAGDQGAKQVAAEVGAGDQSGLACREVLSLRHDRQNRREHKAADPDPASNAEGPRNG